MAIGFRVLPLAASGIAFDAASNSGYQTAQSTYSWSHTCTGANRYLIVGISMLSVGGSSVSSITYNGVALSLIDARASVSGAVRAELWGLVAPATGSNTIVVTLSTSLDSIGGAVSSTGVHQSSPLEGAADASATNVGAADATVNVVTVADNDWCVDVVATSDTAITVGAGQTSRNNVTGTLGSGAMSTEGPKTPAGTVTMSWTNVGALATWSIVSVALRPISAADTLVVGWQRGVDDFNPRAPARFQPPAGIALTPATLPPQISGMAWRQPFDELPPRRLGKSDPPPFGRAIVQIVPPPNGWGLIASIDDQPRKRNFVDAPAITFTPVTQFIGVPWANWLDILPKAPPKQQPSSALALTPATLPPVVSGMAWFTTTDVYQPRRWFINDPSHVPYAPDTVTWSFFSSDTVFLPDPPIDRPPAFGITPPAQVVGISGIAWFEPPDRNRPAVKINGEAQPAIALIPATLPPQISGMAWFEPPDPLPRPAPKPHWGAAAALIPVAAPTPISGIAWFEPPDRDRPAVKINGECPPAISLTPTTLPPRISGMAWFVPTDRQRPSLTVTIESVPAYNPTGAFLPTPPLVTEVHNFPFIANVGTMMQRW